MKGGGEAKLIAESERRTSSSHSRTAKRGFLSGKRGPEFFCGSRPRGTRNDDPITQITTTEIPTETRNDCPLAGISEPSREKRYAINGLSETVFLPFFNIFLFIYSFRAQRNHPSLRKASRDLTSREVKSPLKRFHILARPRSKEETSDSSGDELGDSSCFCIVRVTALAIYLILFFSRCCATLKRMNYNE